MPDETDAHCSGLNVEDYEKWTGFKGDWRDSWWDDEFLAMMAGKWQTREVQSVLDVGCGVGHWGQRLMPLMSPEATLTGVDAEPAWIDKATERAARKGLDGRAAYAVADARALPYEDGRFDLVTCQTLLMHVHEPEAVVHEMARVLKPGGLFIAAEPNNFATSAAQLMAGPRRTWDQIAPLLEMEYLCALGKEALGEGFYSVGEQLPAFLETLGWVDIRAHQNNKCSLKVPPYRDPHTQVEIDLLREYQREGVLMHVGGTIENVRRFYQAGGGAPERFEPLLQRVRENGEALIRGLNEKTYTSAGGHIHYLVWGRKPENPR